MSSFAKKMKMQLTGLAAALILIDNSTSGPAASPITTNFAGSFSSGQTSGAPSDAVLGLDGTDSVDAFTDTLTFSVGGLTGLSSTVVTINPTNPDGSFSSDGVIHFDPLGVLLDGIPFVACSGPSILETCATSVGGLAPGSHTITISGTTTGFKDSPAAYSGTLILRVAPVPEPATWGMMLLGFGIVGAGMRSRKRTMVLA